MTPQEKKALSYERDRRNAYGEHDKSSRRNIRRNKRFPNRANRHRVRQAFKGAEVERAEERLSGRRDQRWRKCGDAALKDVVAYQLRRRARLGIIDPELAEARLRRIGTSRARAQ